MKYQNAIKLSLYVFIFSTVLVFLIPGKGPSSEIELILTISTFLFAILVGFFISRFNNRLDNIRQSVSTEDACWVSLYRTARLINKNFAKKVADLIDEYYIATLIQPLSEKAYKEGSPSYFKIYDLIEENIHQFKKDEMNRNLITKMASDLSTIEDKRNTTSVLASEKITKGQWVILFFLVAIIIFCIFYIKTNALFPNIAVVFFTTSVFMALLIMRDIQNLILGGSEILNESGQEVLEFIGKPRFYNEEYLKRGKHYLAKDIKEYRLYYKDKNGKYKIKIVKNK